MNAIKWLDWGGPHLLLPQAALVLWKAGEGSSKPEAEEPSPYYVGPTDYDRACAVQGLIEEIGVGPYRALVLGDEVPMSTLLQRPDGSLTVFVAMTWVDDTTFIDEGRIAAALLRAEGRYASTGIDFVHTGSDVTLWAAAFPGNDVKGVSHLKCPLAPGNYAVLTADISGLGGEFRAHHLQRRS